MRRADALLARLRGTAAAPAAAAVPTPPETSAPSAPDPGIPTLTEIIPAERLPAVTSASGEVISRVQAQNLEHSLYQKLKRDLDQQITKVMQERFMPEIGSALDAALAKISMEIKSDINGLVRASIEETLRAQIKNLRAAVEARSALQEAEMASAMASGAPGGSPSTTALAKSYEPAAIESRWYAAWERNGYFRAGLDELMELAQIHRVAIMCAEAVWWRCHRSLVADALTARGWQVWHIVDAGEPKLHRYTSPARIVDGALTYHSDPVQAPALPE